jgi:hypothetical protein
MTATINGVEFGVWWAPAGSWNTASPTWVDITVDVVSVQFRRGANGSLDGNGYAAGTGTVVLANNGRKYDPDYSSGTYFGQLLPGKPFRVTFVNSAGTTVTVFRGVTQGDWEQNYEPANRWATAHVDFVDAYALAAASFNVTSGATKLAHEAFNTITAVSGWPLRDTPTASSALVVEPNETRCLPALQLVEVSEQGRIFVDRTGTWRFINRDTFLSAGSSVATFDDDGTDVGYSEVTTSAGREQLRSFVTLTGSHTTDVTASVDTNGPLQGMQIGGVWARQEEPRAIAPWLATRLSTPATRADRLQWSPLQGGNAAKDALSVDVGDTITVVRRPVAVGSAITMTSVVESVSMQIQASPRRWDVTFVCRPEPRAGRVYLRADGAGSTTADGSAVAAP